MRWRVWLQVFSRLSTSLAIGQVVSLLVRAGSYTIIISTVVKFAVLVPSILAFTLVFSPCSSNLYFSALASTFRGLPKPLPAQVAPVYSISTHHQHSILRQTVLSLYTPTRASVLLSHMKISPARVWSCLIAAEQLSPPRVRAHWRGGASSGNYILYPVFNSSM